MPKLTPGSTIRSLSEIAARLPQAFALLTGREFGPGQPLQPDTGPAEQTQGPRQFDYPTAVNMIVSPRQEYPQLQLQPFDLLRSIAANYDIAAICQSTIIDEIQNIDFTVAARDQKQQTELQPVCDALNTFFMSPDRQNGFLTWLARLLDNVLSIDALTVYKHLDVAGRLYALEIVDGATIKPVIDDRGIVVAYQQVIHGLPFSQYTRGGNGGGNKKNEIVEEFGSQEIIYKPRWPRADSPYGRPPIEKVLTRAQTALRKQNFDLAWFTKGNIPDMLMSPPDTAQMNPAQVRTFEDDFNADLEGDDNARRKIKILPWKPGYVGQGKTFSSDPAFDDWMMRVTAAAYSVQPSELGFTDKVNKSSSGGQENIQYRRGIGPLVKWLIQEIFNPIIAEDLGQPDCEMVARYGEKEDDLAQAQIDDIYIKNGTLSQDEVRHLRFANDVDGPAPGMKVALELAGKVVATATAAAPTTGTTTTIGSSSNGEE